MSVAGSTAQSSSATPVDSAHSTPKMLSAPISVVAQSLTMDSSDTFHHFLCHICNSIFTDPVVAMCGHSFCAQCLEKQPLNYLCASCGNGTKSGNWSAPPNNNLNVIIKR
jgi:hypothetical protein